MEMKLVTGSGTHALKVDKELLGKMRGVDAGTAARFVEQTSGAAPKGEPSVAKQMLAQLGCGGGTTLLHAMSGGNLQSQVPEDGMDAATVRDSASITGRLVVQAYLVDAVEATMQDDLSGYAKLLRDNAAIVRKIDDYRWETPVLDFKRPANSRPKPLAQLSEPTRMLTLTASTKTNAIHGDSIGIEIAEQATKGITIDTLGKSMRRQASQSSTASAMYQLLSLLSGDADYGFGPLAAAIGGAAQASQLDSAAGGGKLTQKAWMKWLLRRSLARTIKVVMTDLEGAMAIEGREGRPTRDKDNGTSKRIDTVEVVANPMWPNEVKLIVVDDPSWPAGTIVGFDNDYGYNYITSTAVDYKATEELVMRRSTKLRVDVGSAVERFMVDAWDILDIN